MTREQRKLSQLLCIQQAGERVGKKEVVAKGTCFLKCSLMTDFCIAAVKGGYVMKQKENFPEWAVNEATQ